MAEPARPETFGCARCPSGGDPVGSGLEPWYGLGMSSLTLRRFLGVFWLIEPPHLAHQFLVHIEMEESLNLERRVSDRMVFLDKDL